VNTHKTGPQVRISPAAEQKIRHWVNLARGAGSGRGPVVARHDGALLIEEVYLIEQECTGSHTELDDQAVAQLLVQLDAEGIDIGTIRCWWHSHGGMQAYWSSTDTACVAGLANDSYLVSLVTNKHGQDRLRVDLYQPFHATFDNLPLQIAVGDLGLRDLCEVEFREKVDELVMQARVGPRSGCQLDGLTAVQRHDPPWPHEQHDDDGWWDSDEWALPDDDQLALQVDDPWGRVLALEAGR